MSIFVLFNPHMVKSLFLCLTSCLNYAALSHAGLLEVPVIYPGSLGYFSVWGPMLPDGRSWKKL
jgi:hypothetical protein